MVNTDFLHLTGIGGTGNQNDFSREVTCYYGLGTTAVALSGWALEAWQIDMMVIVRNAMFPGQAR